jgi:hypothetical protein
MEFIPTLAMAALTLKIIDLLRYARAADFNGVLTQLCAWIAGVVVVVLAAQTEWASGISIGDKNMHTLGFWSLVFYGLSAGSVGSVAVDARKAIDNSNSAAIPVLVPPAGSNKVTDRTEVG